MVAAINFAVRDSAGSRQLGSFAGEGQGNFIQVGAGDHISLNLSQGSILAYEQQGSDLLIKLVDGRVIIMAGYFAADDAHLYLSSDGTIAPVEFTHDGTGVLAANYGPVQGFEKWSPLDDLRFDGSDMVADNAYVADEPATMGMFAPAALGGMGGAGAVGAGLIGTGLIGVGGGGGGGTDTTTGGGEDTTPGGGGEDTTGGGGGQDTTTGGGGQDTSGGGGSDAVDVSVTEGTESVGHVENLDDYQDGVTIGGEGDAGSTITVTVDGHTQTTVVGEDGSWTVTFPTTDIEGGERSTEVTVTATNSTGATTTVTETLVLDTVPNPIGISPVTADNTVSQAEYDAGFSIGGTTAGGATVTLTIAGVTQTTTANEAGEWSVDFPAGSITGGTYEATVTASTVDAAGNTSSSTRTFAVDTEVTVGFAPDPIAGDNVINMVEASNGVTMTGTSQAGSTVQVEWGGTTLPATTDAAGNWTVTFPGASVPVDGTATATVSATDGVGNTSSATRTLVVDTYTDVSLYPATGDDLISGTERTAGVTINGSAEANSAITVEFDGVTRTTTAGADGSWSVTYATNEIRSGFYEAGMHVTAVDPAGNVATDARMVAVDTETFVQIDARQLGGDDVISAAERAAGVTLTGSAEPGATVQVTLAGTTRTVTADGSGNWQASYTAAEIPTGTNTQTVTVQATDTLGNTASTSHIIAIDTEVVPLTRTSLGAGADNVVNAAEAANGITITGTVEAGSSVQVTFANGQPIAATVAANGTWSVNIPAGDIPAGEASARLTVTATDRYGNTRTHAEDVAVDRVVRDFGPADTQLAGDGYLNAAEAAQGLTINGTAEAGASVVVRIAGGGSLTTTADASGHWSTTFTGAGLPRGELETSVSVTATDRAGNVSSYSQPLAIDTIAPGAPDVLQFTRNVVGLTRIETDEISENYDFTRVDANGQVSHIDAVRSVDEVFGTQNVSFGYFDNGSFHSTPVPDGSYLIVNSTDTAGNESSTLLVVNNTNAPDVDLSRSGLDGFDLSAVDLTFAPDSQLTITEAQILSLTGPDHTLVVKGGADDLVTLTDATATGQTQQIDGEVYNIYTVGQSGATVLLDDDITTV